MSAPRTYELELTTDAAGAAVGFFESARGRVVSLQYVPDDTDTPAAGTTALVETGVLGTVLLATVNVGATEKLYHPRVAVHGSDGAASTALEQVRLAKERVKVTLASGGDTKKALFRLVVE